MKANVIIVSILFCFLQAFSRPDTDLGKAESDYKAALMLLKEGFVAQAEKLILSSEFKGSSYVDPHKGTLLIHVAAYNLEHAALKIVNNENINMKSGKYGATPLCVAAQYGSEKIVKLLLKNGADANIPAQVRGIDFLPINFAAGNCHLNVVKMLHEKDPKVIHTAGRSPLHSAAWADDLPIVKYLLSQGALITKRDTEGRIPVYYATDSEVVRLLTLPIVQDGSTSASVRGWIRTLALRLSA